MRRILCLLLFLTASENLIFCLPERKILSPDDWAYDALVFLSLEQGVVFPADSSLTVTRARMLLDELDGQKLSEAGLALYDELCRYLDSQPSFSLESGSLSGALGVILEPEVFWKSSEENAWIYDYHQRHSFLSLPLELSFDPHLSAELIPFIAQHEKFARLHDNRVNFPYTGDRFDLHFPKTGYLSLGTEFGEASGVEFALGIGSDFFGRTKTGSIIFSDYPEYISYAKLSLYSPKIRYAAAVSQLAVNKYLYLHSFHFRFAQWMNISLIEGVMVNAPLELRFLNPSSVFHGFEAYKTYGDYNDDLANGTPDPNKIEDHSGGGSRVGSYFGIKFELQPIRFWRFYGLFAMNQLQLPAEYGDLTPNAFALQAGTEAAIPASLGYWHFGLEGVYTLPYMYVLHHKDWSFYIETDTERHTRFWLGTPFGPDSIAGTLWFGYKTLRWEALFAFVFAAQGERSGTEIFDRTPKEYRPDPEDYDEVIPPTGVPIYTYTASLGFLWKPLPRLNLRFRGGYRYTDNYGHIKGNRTQGVECAFSARWML